MSSYTLWYSCYIDLLRRQGVGSVVVEKDDKITHARFISKENTTINELNLCGVLLGLECIPAKEEIHIKGPNQYVDGALRKLSTWMKEDGVIDLKAHSEILKKIWSLMRGPITSQYFLSRRTDPMLWTTSQVSRSQFRMIQEVIIKSGTFPDNRKWDIFSEESLPTKKERLFELPCPNPLTDLQMEKAILKKREEEFKKQAEPKVPHLRIVSSA